MIYLYFALTVIAILAFLERKNVLFLVCVFGLMTRFFMLDTTNSELAVRGSDLALGLFLLLLPISYKRDPHVFSVSGDSLTRWVYLYMAFYWVELIVTVIAGRESLVYSLKVIRSSFVLWSFFVLKTIPIGAYKHFLKVALWITLIQGVLFLLQFLGIKLLAGSGVYEGDFILGDASRTAINTPPLAVFFLFLLWKVDYLRSKRTLILFFLMSLILLTFVRGTIIALLIGFAYFAIVGAKKKNRISIALAFLLLIPITSRVIEAKSVKTISTTKELLYLFGNRGNLTNIDKGTGNFSFRIAMLVERVSWLSDNTEYLLMGVGTMHEDSPNTLRKFNFQIGTINEGRKYGYTIVESGDITWVPIVLRYGLIGVFLHFMMFVILFISTHNRKDALVVFASLSIFLFVRSFDCAYFERPSEMYFLTLFFAIVSRSNYKSRPLLL